jgi:uncharacterized membrane-anchored protein
MALKGFENITQDLTEFEVEQVVPMIVRGLSQKIGKANAVNNKYICEKINKHPNIINKYKLNGVKLRKIIQYIRLRNIIEGLCSSSNGYYVAENMRELKMCIDSLTQRINTQTKVRDMLTKNMISKYQNIEIFKEYNNIV